MLLELDSSGMQLEMVMVRTAVGQERKPIEATVGPGLASGGQDLLLTEAAGGQDLLLTEASGGQDLLLTEASGGQGLLLKEASGGQDLLRTEAAGGQGLLLAEAAGGGAKTSGWLSKCSTKHLFVCSLSKLAVLRKRKQNLNTLQHYTVSRTAKHCLITFQINKSLKFT